MPQKGPGRGKTTKLQRGTSPTSRALNNGEKKMMEKLEGSSLADF